MTALDELRRYAVVRSLFEPTTLTAAIERLGFVQSDPIRAPARAQDLCLRQRVVDYRAGDLDRAYASLDIEEDFYVNYGFIPRAHHALMLPRTPRRKWSATETRRARLLLAFVRERGEVHPRDADEYFAHGKVVNAWGGTSNATTHLLGRMHYRGMLRVTRRDGGVRTYAVREPAPRVTSRSERRARLDTLIDVIFGTYAPMPLRSLNALLARMRYATPQLLSELAPAVARARQRYRSARIDGVHWFWPALEDPALAPECEERVRLLAPFDPVVWDRRRFELLFGWGYRFEAYTPVAKRKLGYYALPLLWRDRVIGWGNLSLKDEKLHAELGYVSGRRPREPAFQRELEAELARVRAFLR